MWAAKQEMGNCSNDLALWNLNLTHRQWVLLNNLSEKKPTKILLIQMNLCIEHLGMWAATMSNTLIQKNDCPLIRQKCYLGIGHVGSQARNGQLL